MTVLADSFTDVYSAALRGEHCQVIGSGGIAQLPVETWTRAADDADRMVLGHCHGPTVDVGCGPGRMADHLTRSGTATLGIDIVAEAVQQARGRGVAALERDVFDHLPGEGRWSTVLLADGNIGIGGDPRRLLQRCAEVLAPGGRIVVDLAQPGSGVQTRRLRLRTRSAESQPFAWSTVAADRIGVTAAGLGLRVGGVDQVQDRWFAVLLKDAQ